MRRTFDAAVAVAVGLMVAILAVGAALNSRNIRGLVDDMRRVQHTRDVRDAIAAGLRSVGDAVDAQQLHRLTREQEYLDRFEAAAVQSASNASRLSDLLASDQAQNARVSQLKQHIDELVSSLRDGIAATGASEGGDASTRPDAIDASAQLAEINALGAEMQARENRLLLARERRVADATRFALIVAAGAVAIGLLFFWAVLWMIRRNFANQLRSASQIQSERERLEVTLNSIGDGVIATDAAGRVTYLNAIAERMTGRSLADAVGQPLTRVCQIVDEATGHPAAVQPGRPSSLDSKRPPTTLLLTRTNGDNLLVTERSAPIRNAQGQEDGAVVVLHDVTDQRRHTRAIHDREEQIRLLLDSTAEGIYGIDLDGHCTLCNAATVRMLGYEQPSDLLGQQMHALIHSRRPDGSPLPRSECNIRAALVSGAGAHSDEECFWRADGQPLPVEYWSHPVVRDGELVGAVVTFLDVSERKRTELARAERSRLAQLRAEVSSGLVSQEDQRTVFTRCLDSIVAHTTACGAQIWTDDQAQFAARLRSGDALVAHDATTEGADGASEVADAASTLESELVANSRLGGYAVGDCTKGAEHAADFLLQIEGKVVGVLAVFSAEPLPPREHEELTPLAGQLAQFIVRRRAEEALFENERQFTVMADAMPQHAWMAQPDGHVFWFNKQWFDYTGTTLEQVEGWGWQRVHDPDELPRVLERIKRSFATGEPWEDTYTLRRHDGELRWFLGRMLPIRDSDGQIVRWFGTNTDVTDEREAAEALRRSEERFRQLADAMPQFVWVTDAEGEPQYFNHRWYEYIGCTVDECRGFGWLDFLHPEDRERARQRWSQAVTRGNDYEIEYRIRSRDGDYRWFLGRGAPVHDAHGAVRQWYGTCTDIHDRKRIEEERGQLQFLVENSREFIGVYDLDGVPSFINRAGRRLVGLDEGVPASSLRLAEFFFPEDLAFIEQEFVPRVLNEGSAEVEIRFRHFLTGQPLWMAYSVVAVHDASGKSVGLATVSRDITDRKHAEQELTESQEFLRSAMDALTSHIAVIDEHGQILAVNDAWRAFGDANDLRHDRSMVGANYLEACRRAGPCDDNTPDVTAGIQQVIDGQRSTYVLEYPCHSPTHQRWFQMRVSRFRGSEPARVVIAHEDITHRMLSERQTLERSKQLRTLAELALKLGVLDSTRDILEATTAAARTAIGTRVGAASHLIGNDWSRAETTVAYDDGPEGKAPVDGEAVGIPAMARLVCQQNKPLRLTQQQLVTHPVTRQFGSPHDGNGDGAAIRGLLAAPLVGFSGRNLGLIQLVDKLPGDFTADDESIVVQIAQMASVALENVRLYRELREADRRKDQFLATLAHELRNPLAPLSNALELIAMEPDNAAQTADYADLAARQCNQLRRLIDDLLDVSRIATGKFRLHRQPVVLQQAIETALDMSRPAVADADHELKVNLPEDPASVSGDPVRLAQIVANLLINAAKYTPMGGRIELSCDVEGKDAVLTVQDSGIGIPASRLDDIFDLFSQIDASTTRSQGGLGIGLTLVKTLVQLHGGSIRVESDGPGQGSKFTVRLPLLDESESSDVTKLPTKARQFDAHELPKYRIMVVDDNRAAALLLSRLLGKLGQDVTVTDSGRGALEMLDESNPDILMSDVAMPEMSGYELAREVRARKGDEVLLIALTGYGQASDRHDALEAGFTEHLVKPIAVETLVKVLSQVETMRLRG